ncbi:MAG: phosphotransferase family protein [Candidatus Heimdallarchaeota archaeon]
MVNQVNLDKIRTFLSEKFQTDKIVNLKIRLDPSVNHHVTFELEKKKYIMKIMTRKPAAEHENYRLEKEAELLMNFKRLEETQKYSAKKHRKVPVPEVFHVEKDEKKIGYKFIITDFIEGELLENIWSTLQKMEKERIVIQLAEIIQSIHSIKYDMFGDIEEFDCPRRFYTYVGMIRSNIRRDARKIGPKNLLPIKLITQAVKFVEDNIEKINLDFKPTLIHNDLHFGNIIIKKDDDTWIVKAILDFEWAAAGNPIVDLLGVKEEFPLDKELEKQFFEKYSKGKFDNIDNYKLEEKITTVISEMSSIATGWINFHPTEENLNYAQKRIEKMIID